MIEARMREAGRGEPTADAIAALLARERLPAHDEKALQAAIAGVLAANGLAFVRELRVAGGIVDFLAGAVGIEVKIAGGARAVLRQCARYAADPRIAELLVVSARALILPPAIGGKPCRVLALGRAWL